MTPLPGPIAEVTRDARGPGATDRAGTHAGRDLGPGLVESRHVGHLVVVADAEVVRTVGDPDRLTFVRSTAKPFQATGCLELLGDRADPLSDAEVALSWASHRAEPVHVATAHQLLARSGTAPEALTCPPARGQHDPAAVPARILHDCSGKHAMFALAGSVQGTPRERLLDPDAPLQRTLHAVLEDVFGPVPAVGTDGCGAPAVAVPLVALARAYGRLASEPRWRRVREAGFAQPSLVGGAGRLESALLAAGVVAKVGAEGVFAAGWRAPDGSPRGLAVKAEDGEAAAAAVAAHAALVDAEVVAADLWAPEPVLGGGRPVGVVRACLPR